MKHRYSSILIFLSILVSSSLSAQLSYVFTSAGATGSVGPTQGQLNTEYASTNLQGAVTSANGIQIWTVPSSGLYSIEAYGAQGGGANGGFGAKVSGEFLLSGGDILHIVVGQQGLTDPASATGVGGGGGSFVVKSPAIAVGDILVIAGGGGGAASTIHPDRDASATNNGNNGLVAAGVSNPDGAGGTGGNGGNKSVSGCSLDRGAGGGGFLTDGGSICQSAGAANGGSSFLNGAQGGTASGAGSIGGFGGGGATWSTGFRGSGGGGGYSGGGAGQINADSPNHAGGGGGSYNSGLNQSNTGGFNAGNGQVVISPLSSPIPNEAGMAGIDSPTLPTCAGTYPLQVTVANFGNNQITSLDVQWTLNGGPVSTQAVTSVIDTSGGAGSSTASVNLGNITISDSTEIKVWTSLPNGVLDTSNSNDTILLSFFASNPILNLPDVGICDGNFAILDAGSQWASYAWNTGETSQQIVILAPGTYTISVVDTFNCPATDQIIASIANSPSINLGQNIIGCDQRVLNAGNAGGSYQWNTNDTTQSIVVTESGVYLVTVTTAAGCVGSDGVAVEIYDSPSINLGDNFSICTDLNESRLLAVSGSFVSYNWSTGSNQSSIIIDGNQGLQNGPNTITLGVIDENGCQGNDTIVATIKTCIPAGIDEANQDEQLLLYPNPATDLLTVSSSSPIIQLEIMDITGRVVLSSASRSTLTRSIDVSQLKAGSYMVKVKTNATSTFQTVIIK